MTRQPADDRADDPFDQPADEDARRPGDRLSDLPAGRGAPQDAAAVPVEAHDDEPAGAAPHRARLFAAVWPPPDVVDAIAAVPRPDVDGLHWTRRDQWHVTLVFLGTSDVERTVAAFRGVALPPGPVTATLGPVTGRFGRRIVHVPVAGLDEVAAAVRAALPGEDDRPFTGHLTLARARGGRVDLSSVVGVPLAASFPVAEVTLVASELGRGPGGGARYRVLERLAL